MDLKDGTTVTTVIELLPHVKQKTGLRILCGLEFILDRFFRADKNFDESDFEEWIHFIIAQVGLFKVTSADIKRRRAQLVETIQSLSYFVT